VIARSPTVELRATSRVDIDPPRYAAVVMLDGRATTWTCTHLHLSARTARACIVKTEQTAAEWAQHAVETKIEDNLFEWRNGSTTKRWRFAT
jgi:hypothetical protein